MIAKTLGHGGNASAYLYGLRPFSPLDEEAKKVEMQLVSESINGWCRTSHGHSHFALPFDVIQHNFCRAEVQSAELTDEVLALHQRKYFSGFCIEKVELI